MDIKTMDLNGRRCHIYEGTPGSPAVIIGIFSGEDGYPERIVQETAALTDKPFSLIAFETEDWDGDFSPWKTEGLKEGEVFEGNGPKTLDWVTESAVTCAKQQLNCSEIYAAGYSLAGLFALWSIYNTDVLAGAVCCSGSLWFEGWMDYAAKTQPAENSKVYISLGGKEEKSPVQIISTIGTCTREMDKLLEANANISAHKLEWNKGGHFADSAKRLAKGIAWILES